jgi:DNA-binding response OmpR family regulator
MERPYKILVIDDEQGICEKIQTFFTKRGLIVETAFDGEEGLNKLRTGGFDAAIVDIKMPKMNGIEVAQRVNQEGIDTDIIMLTGHGDREDAVKALKARVVRDWIDKDDLEMSELFRLTKEVAQVLPPETIRRILSVIPDDED